jgi:hypothetical protein
VLRFGLNRDGDPLIKRTSALVNCRAREETRHNGNAKKCGDADRRSALWGTTDGIDLFCDPGLTPLEVAHEPQTLQVWRQLMGECGKG